MGSRILHSLHAIHIDRILGQSMQISAMLISSAVLLASWPAHAQSVDDDLRLYAVGVVNVTPFQMPFSGVPPFKLPFSGYGIYLGGSTVITAAHVVGHWPLFTNPKSHNRRSRNSGQSYQEGCVPAVRLGATFYRTVVAAC